MRTAHMLLAALAMVLLAGGQLVLALPPSNGGTVKGHDGEDPDGDAHTMEPASVEHHDDSSDDAEEDSAPDDAAASQAVPSAKHPLEAAKVMSELDTNHDGKISPAELVARLKQVHKTAKSASAGSAIENMTDLMAAEKDYFKTLDKNGDGHLSLSEKLASVVMPGAGETAAEKKEHADMMAEMQGHAKKEFADMDGNKDGKLSYKEYIHLLGKEQHAAPAGFPHHADKNGDKHLSEAEYGKLHEMPAMHDKHAPEEEKKAAAATNKELRAASRKDFKAADTNHDGRLSAQEYSAIGSEHENTDDTKEQHASKDANHDGFLSLAEFKDAAATDGMDEEQKKLTEGLHNGAEQESRFKSFDTNHDGKLSAAEFHKEQTASSQESEHDSMAKDIMGNADTNGDGHLSAAEVEASGLAWDTHPQHDDL